MSWLLVQGDARSIPLEDESVQCVVTSPPYWGLRDYGIGGQLGLESTPEEYVAHMVEVFREVRRVLRDDGTVWLNLGDSYASGKSTCHNPGGGETSLAGHAVLKKARAYQLDKGSVVTLRQSGLKPKDLVGIPWRVAFALQADGWWLRSDIVWSKPNPMPESVRDRPTKAHEYVFLLTKRARYYYDQEAVKEAGEYRGYSPEKIKRKRNHGGRTDGYTTTDGGPGLGNYGTRNRRTVWTIATQPFSGAHFATFPPALIEPCILAGCPERGLVLDPFAGAGTTMLVAERLGRNSVGLDLSEAYLRDIARPRIIADCPMFNGMATP